MKRGPLLAGALSISVAAVLRLFLAPLRLLSADEAYYLCAARRGPSPWPIDDHPPLLGAYLALADRLMPGPLELRVRVVAIALQALTALGVAHLASHIGRTRGDGQASDAWALGAVLATWGLLPMAGGLLATPDAPMLAALAWMLALLAEPFAIPRMGGEVRRCGGLLALSALAVASKASALPFALVIAGAQLARKQGRQRGLAIALGALLAAPLAQASLRAQLDHVVGRGAMVAAPDVGPFAAMGAFIAGQILLLGPAVTAVVIVVLMRARRGPEVRVPAGAWLATALVLLAALASALLSGRPPEPNWTAPAAVLIFAVTAVGTARASRARRHLVLGVTMAPALVAVTLWSLRANILPPSADPLSRVPRLDSERTFFAGAQPHEARYAHPAWRCVYANDCQEIDAIFSGSR